MGWYRRSRAVVGSGLAVAALGALPALAEAAPYEPNDTIAQAIGPLNGGQDYVAAIESDPDYYYFNVVGQRQLDIAATKLGGTCDDFKLLDPDGRRLVDSDISTTTSHIRYTTPGNSQYVLKVDNYYQGCQYKLRIDPADAITQAPPGVVLTLGQLEGSDDSQRVLVDGQVVGSSQGTTGPTVISLGVVAPTARIMFEVQNQSGGWSWNVALTNQESRNLVTTFSEKQSSDSSSARLGVVRRVTMSPSGGIFDTCGEALAPTICDPPLPVVTPPPPGPSSACVAARKRRASSAAQVKATRKALSRAVRRSTRRKLSRRLATQRRTLSRRTSAMRSACDV